MSTNKCGCDTTTTINCNCELNLSSDCITLAEDLTCSNTLKGQTLTEAIKLLDTYICERFDSVQNFISLINVGEGSEIYKGNTSLGKKQLRTLIDSGLINLSQDIDTITISVDEVALNTFIETNQKTYTALNTGIGSEIYKSVTVVGDNTQFNLRKLKSSNSTVSIVQGIDDIDVTVSPGDLSPLEKINEGSGEGIVIRGRVAANYGNVGLNAVDLSFSSTPSELKGATGELTFTTGEDTTASAYGAFASGLITVASGVASHVEGSQAKATGYAAHAEGSDTLASGVYSHSEGGTTIASGAASHSEGLNCEAIGDYSHSEGHDTFVYGETAHGEGDSNEAYGNFSHVGGINNTTRALGETVIGHYATDSAGSATTIVQTDRLYNIGNGTSEISRSDAFTVLKNGLVTLPSVTNALISAASGKAIVTKEYLTSVLPISVDGSETKLTSSTNITITGTGTIANPYIISSVDTNTTYSAGAGLVLSGTIINLDNLQKVITYPADFTGTNYTLTNADNNYEIIIDNGATAVTVTVPSGLTSKIGVGFTQKGTGDVTYTASGTTINNPIGLKIKGQYYQTYLSQELNTNNYFLGGSTKI